MLATPGVARFVPVVALRQPKSMAHVLAPPPRMHRLPPWKRAIKLIVHRAKNTEYSGTLV